MNGAQIQVKRTTARRLLGLGRPAAQNGGATRILSACAVVYTDSPSCLWARGGIDVSEGGRAMRGFIEMPRRCSALNSGVVKC